MRSFRTFAVWAAVLAFLLAVLGSWVRINGAGMTCPDWPLCKGRLVPALEGGVVLEWTHRLIAAVEGVVLVGAIVAGWRARRHVAGVGPALGALGVIFAVQVALGGLTVQLSNRPDSVVWHWATAMALIATLASLATLAVRRPARLGVSRGVLALGAAAATAFAAMAAGAYVSSSGAGLACPASGLPWCAPQAPAGVGPLQHAQMLHRLLAALFVVAAVAATAILARAPGRARVFAAAGCGLTALQVALGVANVVWQLPIALREAHAANAAATFVLYVVATVVAAIEAPPAPARAVPTVRGEIAGGVGAGRAT